MKNKLLLVLILFVSIFTIVGCGKSEKKTTGEAFKKDYEEINGTTSKSGKEHRTITISENNSFVETTAEDVVTKIKNEDSFYVYFGSRLCPWCRSVIEMADKISRENEIDKIYYIDIWDDEGNEIVRDKYIVNSDNELEKTVEGTDSYKELLEYFKDFLRDYSVTNEAGEEVPTGEKRIYAPNFFYISNGKVVRMVTGKSDKQKDSREELTEEMLKDEEETFNKFFVNACDSSC